MTRSSPPPDASLAAVSLAWLAHLQQEEALLAETLASLGAVRSALRGGDLESLHAALEQQARIADASSELLGRRARLRSELSYALGVPPDAVTLATLATAAPPDVAGHLRACRERLRGMSAEVDRLNRANAALAAQSLDFLQRFLSEITDTDSAGAVYGPSGSPHAPVAGALLEGRG
jgi:hypothetical protein